MTYQLTQGMDRHTGRLLAPHEHLRQSVRDILLTPIGSRLMRRDYGSLLPFLVDAPATATTRLRLMSAIATALIKYEPRISIRQIHINTTATAQNATGNVGWDIVLDLTAHDDERFLLSLSVDKGVI